VQRKAGGNAGPVLTGLFQKYLAGAGLRLCLVSSFLELFIFSPESFDAPRRINQFLFSSIEGVALGTNFHPYFLLGGTCRDFVATSAFDYRAMVFRMNIVFHLYSFPQVDKYRN
jgi:hypothetical protein